MNKYDWKNAFPKPSENFHNKLCMTLDSFEKENVKMKKVSFKKSIIIAAAVLAVGTVAFASKGAVNYVMGSTSVSYTHLAKLAVVLDTSVDEVNKAVDELKKEYSENHRGFNIIDILEGYQICSRPEYYTYIQEILGEQRRCV